MEYSQSQLNLELGDSSNEQTSALENGDDQPDMILTTASKLVSLKRSGLLLLGLAVGAACIWHLQGEPTKTADIDSLSGLDEQSTPISLSEEYKVDIAAEEWFTVSSDFTGYLANIMKFPANVTKADKENIVGAKRSTTLFGPKLEVEEELTALDKEKLTYSWQMTKFGPFPVSSYKTTISVKQHEDGSLVKCVLDVDFTGPTSGMPAKGAPPFATKDGFIGWQKGSWKMEVETAAKLASATGEGAGEAR